MRTSLPLLTALSAIASVLAQTLPCDVNSDSCRAVMDATACFNEYLSQGSKATILNCLAGTDGAGTPTQKMCACTGCVAPVLVTWINKNNVCT